MLGNTGKKRKFGGVSRGREREAHYAGEGEALGGSTETLPR